MQGSFCIQQIKSDQWKITINLNGQPSSPGYAPSEKEACKILLAVLAAQFELELDIRGS